ncbi:HEPN domain-containing protein [Catellatospora chokoriensis]|uniref:HEPN domain-containing protein n=1 Tax=Catellatospora chokoriensis TaxID=310353 RepID=UPI00177E4C74|nr:HEPN domain-containing protein [Catellatospora chokoriensis]
MTDPDSPVASAARAFLGEAWSRLRELGVVPPSPYRRHLRVGRDYFGDDVMHRPAFKALESAIEAAYSRFNPVRPLGAREFPSSYVFPFLETFVARLGRQDFAADGPVATETIRDLEAALAAEDYEVVCCRAVSHMTTTDGQPIDFTHVRVAPVDAPAHDHTRRLLKIVEEALPGGAHTYVNADLHMYAPPESVVISQESQPKLEGLNSTVSQRIERFMLLVRLLKPGSSESMFEVQGSPSPIRPPQPQFERFRGAGPVYFSFTPLAARDIVLSVADVPRVDGLDKLLASVDGAQPGMVFTSLGMALNKFVLAYHSFAWFEQIVDLATAFEAALSGVSTSDVTLRLRTRAAGLLATSSDPATAIFDDIKVLYELRSKLVHGGSLTLKTLLKGIGKLSTVPTGVPDGEMPAHAVERLRDLVRRAILARICLAAGAAPLWPIALDRDDHVDAALADDVNRGTWRDAWHQALASFDALGSTERPGAAGPAVP